jgi:hypothetical protein
MPKRIFDMSFEDEITEFSQNVRNQLSSVTLSYPRRKETSTIPAQKPESLFSLVHIQ